MRPFIQRIALIGAESTGKSTLAHELADRLPAIAVDEVLREFCQRRGRAPEPHEQAAIAAEQRAREQDALARARRAGYRWVICDTTPLMVALYSVHYFNDPSLLGAAIAHQRGYALTLLTEPDLPWVADGLQRESPQLRQRLHQRLHALLCEESVDFNLVRGVGGVRLARALEMLDAVAACSAREPDAFV